MVRENFYTFFLPATIPNRSKAINAVVAGVISGALLTLVLGVPGVVLFIRDGATSQTTVILLTATAILAIVTVGTWKRIVSASILGLVSGILMVAWNLWHHQPAAAILLAIPLVGGFWTATRGILALKVLGSTGSHSNFQPP
jgi:hypothetical protein